MGRRAPGAGCSDRHRGPDEAWADWFAGESDRLRGLLGDVVLGLEHVGSTAVAGLAAKPIIDIDLLVDDPSAEARYVPMLEEVGYRLVLREPWWPGHRMLVREDRFNLHVFPVGAAEPIRHVLFRDRLRSRAGDRDRYATTKRQIATETAANPGNYSVAKNVVIDEIFGRIFGS